MLHRKLEGVKTIKDFESRIGNYGEHSLIEGEIESGDIIGIVDDLVTKFDSKILALRQVEHEVRRKEKKAGKEMKVT